MGQLAKLILFRLDAEGYRELGRREAVFGLVCAWIAGIGRYWDHPSAGWAQKSGLGSVVYVFALSALIWLMLKPLRANRQNYITICAAVGLTSPLAWLYALPVERWFDVGTAISLNMWFLAIVALWRVGLLGRFFMRSAGCSPWRTIVLTLLPLCSIVMSLSALNLEHAVFELMAGIGREDPLEQVIDARYGFLFFLTVIASFAVLPLVLSYAWMVFLSLSGRDREARGSRWREETRARPHPRPRSDEP